MKKLIILSILLTTLSYGLNNKSNNDKKLEKTEKGYKYSVKFEKDAKNLYAIINASLIKN